MARMKKKGESGAAKNFVTRNQALKKLQISLSDFRRLCILKGIHPQQPRSTKKANKGSTAPATFYYAKDIAFLAHEPVLRSLREHKSFAKKLSRAIGRREWAAAKNLEDAKPRYSLDHIIKQRYPSFDEALGDIDDALCTIALFANLPAKMYNLPDGVVDHCANLKRQWDEYVVRTSTLRKTFLSIKGIYFQATIRGKDITWLVPYPFTQHVPHDVDFRIMSTFLELYTTLLSFVLFKLWSDLGEQYPPNLDAPRAVVAASAAAAPAASATAAGLSKKAVRKAIRAIEHSGAGGDDDGGAPAAIADEEDAAAADAAAVDTASEFVAPTDKPGIDVLPVSGAGDASANNALFRNCTFYLDRSTPLSLLTFLLRSFGSRATRIGWDPILAPDSPFAEDDARITHVLIDRPEEGGAAGAGATASAKAAAAFTRREGRRYVQPQWVVDSANRGLLLPEEKYDLGKVLPPHLSPFVEGGAHPEEEGEDAEDKEMASDDSGDEAEEEAEVDEDLAATRPALKALTDALSAGGAAAAASSLEGLLDAAELEAESAGGEAELDRVRALAASARKSTTAGKGKGAGKGKSAGKPMTAEEQEAAEAREMGRGLMSNKTRKFYDKVKYSQARKAEEEERLRRRRAEIKREEAKGKAAKGDKAKGKAKGKSA